MSRFTSSERRGTILLLTVAAILIVCIFLSRRPLATAPNTQPAPPAENILQPDMPADSATMKKRRNRKSKPHTTAPGRRGHSRDFLSEPVG